MTISLTLTVEIVPGKGSDRHLLTSTPLLLSEKNPRGRRPGDLPRQVPLGLGWLWPAVGMAGVSREDRQDARTRPAPLVMPRLPSEHWRAPGSALGLQRQKHTQKTLQSVMSSNCVPTKEMWTF